MLDPDNIGDLKIYSNCFNEAMRQTPPVAFSSPNQMTKTVNAGGLVMRKGDPFSINMLNLANDPDEWIEPEKFIPERFDPQSKYYLTPAGKKRNPYSFSPFLGGMRICLGKTFVESVSKLTATTLITHFKFDFEAGVDAKKFEIPYNSLVATYEKEVQLEISKAN